MKPVKKLKSHAGRDGHLGCRRCGLCSAAVGSLEDSLQRVTFEKILAFEALKYRETERLWES